MFQVTLLSELSVVILKIHRVDFVIPEQQSYAMKMAKARNQLKAKVPPPQAILPLPMSVIFVASGKQWESSKAIFARSMWIHVSMSGE